MATRGFEVKETIDHPVDRVWAVLSDLSKAPAWMGPVERMRPRDGAPIQTGTRLVFEARGAERESTITAFEPNARLEMTSTQSGVTAVYDYRLQAAGNQTEITLDATCTATGWIRILHPIIVRMMRRVDGNQLAALKRLIESDPALGH